MSEKDTVASALSEQQKLPSSEVEIKPPAGGSGSGSGNGSDSASRNGKTEVSEIERELEDIMENEAYDSDGVARGRSPGRPPSSSGSVSSSGSGSRGKRRSWKKPKDKPKRPLSAYNLFFKHERQRIVEGRPEECTAEETISAIENILCSSRETRRHRKTHGRISFGDLARKIAEKWKNINPDRKVVFEHYAELDMRRYRQEVKLWKDRKEAEVFAKQTGMDNSANASYSSIDTDADVMLENTVASYGGGMNSDDAWAPRRNFYDSMNSSMSSVDSEFSLEPIPIGDMLRNARPNGNSNGMQSLHNSMPNIGASNLGVPGFVNTANQRNNMMAYQANQSNHNQNNNFPPLIVSSGDQNALQLERLRQQNEMQQQQLQRQQQMLMQQQQLLQQQLQQTNGMMTMNNMGNNNGLNNSLQGMNNGGSQGNTNNIGMSIPSSITSNMNMNPNTNMNNFSGQMNNSINNNNNDNNINMFGSHGFDMTGMGDGKELESYLSNLDLSNQNNLR